jgi:HEPN domain-containing protein
MKIMNNNFDFVETLSPEVAALLNQADDYLNFQNDPHAAIIKTGCAVELIIKEIETRENISFRPGDASLQKRIWNLEGKIDLPEVIAEAMNFIRVKRNEANHEVKATEYDAKECLKKAHKILHWFVNRYTMRICPEYKPLQGIKIII